MKHDWELERKTAATFLTEPKRTCLNCGATQKQVTEQSWGRIVGRKWLPLVGRCKGEQIEKDV